MKVFVTGATGFVGSHFVRQAVVAGHEVMALHRPENPNMPPLLDGVTWIEAQLADVPSDCLKSCDALVHLAAHGVMEPTKATWRECFLWNVSASLELWERASNSGITRFLICGSCFEYGSTGDILGAIPSTAPLFPTGPYHASKAAATMAALGLAASRSLELIVLRPFQVFGEGEPAHRFWAALRQAAMAGHDFPMTYGEQIRDFTPVELVAAEFVSLLTSQNLRPGMPEVRNFGTGKPQTLIAFAEYWWTKWGATGKILPGAIPYRPGEIMRLVPEL